MPPCPRHAIRWPPVVRATMIGVMASAVFPGRIGEPTRVVVLTRQARGPDTARCSRRRRHGLLADADQPARARDPRRRSRSRGAPLLHGHAGGHRDRARRARRRRALLVLAGPRLLALARRSRSERASRLPRQRCPASCDSGAAGPGRVRPPAPRSRRGRLPAARMGAAVAGLLHGRARARAAVAGDAS